MKTISLLVLNFTLIVVFVYLFRKRNLLSYNSSGKWWLTWLAIAIITLMDEFTSIFYAPAEAFRFIGPSAIIYIAVTSVLIRFMSTRFTEIAEILEHHSLIGGGVYSFSYLVMGPMISFAAVASIMVDYILTACLSAVSAVLNASSFFPLVSQSPALVVGLTLGIIWAIAGLNYPRHPGECPLHLHDLHSRRLRHFEPDRLGPDIHRQRSPRQDRRRRSPFARHPDDRFLWTGLRQFHLAHRLLRRLAYSGIESVIQTAGFVQSWREIHKAYIFLAVTVGVATPLVCGTGLILPH